MRVRFGDWNEQERSRVAQLDQSARDLFAAATLAPRDVAWWRTQVAELHPELEAPGTGPGIVISARQRSAVPIAERVVALAPAALNVLSHCPPQAFAAAVEQSGALAPQFRQAGVRAGFGRGHLLDVIVQLPGGSGAEHEQAAAEDLVWALLGERMAEDWIGSVEVTPAPRGGRLRMLGNSSTGFPLSQLTDAVRAAVSGLYEGLPDAPCWQRDLGTDWVLFELTPDEAEADGVQADLLLASTCYPELLRCALEGAPFSSLRFSRHGEGFFCLKYQSDSDSEARLTRRAELEDVLDRALGTASVGRVIGGGTGVSYDYVYLALGNAEAGLSLASGVGRARELPPASWFLPLDSDLASEWSSVWPEASAPSCVRS
ncbi:MAG TPA: hypothetical protein VMF89_17980 [Polyangiales bacterium]|nr:hypothetical protein [Polyangiales bacterium]